MARLPLRAWARRASGARTLALSGVVAMLAGALAVTVSCSTDPTTSYGNPNTLNRGNLPGGDEAGIETVSCADAGIPGDGGCPSFATAIYPQMKADGNWKCAKNGCHARGGTPPIIDDTSAANAYDSLRQVQPIGGTIPYINVASKDPSQSGFYCNCATRTCGIAMPKDSTGVKQLTIGEICTIEAWVKCGSPGP
jgi:hypothetical protein